MSTLPDASSAYLQEGRSANTVDVRNLFFQEHRPTWPSGKMWPHEPGVPEDCSSVMGLMSMPKPCVWGQTSSPGVNCTLGEGDIRAIHVFFQNSVNYVRNSKLTSLEWKSGALSDGASIFVVQLSKTMLLRNECEKSPKTTQNIK
ncbi:hypothetical protein AVEN_172495-1 [Araneus ventricosus]|uniref:Uncharacterized protein n=1 Tax=Araneus ventricosus TaxID=182803 RepID=A0A4Y2DTI5_ARAVE|nr:hypothetical protein AVEN_172495-1 [Araneus ventricosus]